MRHGNYFGKKYIHDWRFIIISIGVLNKNPKILKIYKVCLGVACYLIPLNSTNKSWSSI